jgi:hypothetical protein
VTWERLPVVSPHGSGCLNCPQRANTLPMDAHIGVGFGMAALTRDGEVQWSESLHEWDELLTVEQAEGRAVLDPDRDWRIVLHGPLHGETYQRQGPGYWVCVEANQGFA